MLPFQRRQVAVVGGKQQVDHACSLDRATSQPWVGVCRASSAWVVEVMKVELVNELLCELKHSPHRHATPNYYYYLFIYFSIFLYPTQ